MPSARRYSHRLHKPAYPFEDVARLRREFLGGPFRGLLEINCDGRRMGLVCPIELHVRWVLPQRIDTRINEVVRRQDQCRIDSWSRFAGRNRANRHHT